MADVTASDVPPVFRPPPGHPRFPHYDSLRGIAAVMVVAFHALIHANAMGAPLSAIVSQFELSITLLFMLSAFLLYRPFVAARMGKAPGVAIPDYAFRRALRILPGYWVALAVLAVYPGLTGVFSSDWWAYFGLMQNYLPLHGGEIVDCAAAGACPSGTPWRAIEPAGGIGPAWTLVVEVSFYAFLPFFVLAMGWIGTRLRHPLRFELGLLALLGASSVLLRLYAFEHLAAMGWMLKTLPTIFLWLGAGMALAAISALLQGRRSRLATFVERRPGAPWLAALGLFALLVVTMLPTPDYYGQIPVGSAIKYVTLTVIALLLLLPATFGYDAGGWPRRVMENRVISWIGLIAYGLYLYHVPIMIKLNELGVADIDDAFLRWVTLSSLTLALSIACGAASYYLVERWFLRFKYRRRSRRPVLSADAASYYQSDRVST